MFFVYVIKSDTAKIYIGQTNNIQKRLERHNQQLPSKKSSYTSKQGSIWSLIFIELFTSCKDAIYREKQLKSYQGRVYIKNFINT